LRQSYDSGSSQTTYQIHIVKLADRLVKKVRRKENTNRKQSMKEGRKNGSKSVNIRVKTIGLQYRKVNMNKTNDARKKE